MKKFLIALAACQCMAMAAAQTPASGPSFRCGGIGVEDQQAMKAQAGHHDAMLTFAVSNGAYLSDIAVLIQDSRGSTVLQTRCDGPLMLVDLPVAGNYLITATAQGQTLRRSAQLGGKAKPANLTFIWPVV